MRRRELTLELHARPAPRHGGGRPVARALAVCLLLFTGFVGCSDGPSYMEVRAPSKPVRVLDANPKEMEALGREGLEKLGYARIIELARMAGFVKRKPATKGAGTEGAMLGITTREAMAAAEVFVEVFSEYAVTAGVVSQADSPLPGPADVVALGILMFGIANATVMTAEDLEKVRPKSCGSEYPEVPLCASLPPEYTFSSAGAALAKMKTMLGEKGLKLHSEERAEFGPCPEIGKHFNVRKGGERAGSITCCPCCVEGPPTPRKDSLCRIVR